MVDDAWVFSRLLCLLGRWNPQWFSQPEVMWAPLPNLVLWSGELSMGLRLLTLWGYICSRDNPQSLQRQNEGLGPTLFLSLLFLQVFLWFPLHVLSYNLCAASLQLVYSGWFFYNLVVIPIWFWEEVTVNSIYFATISDDTSS